jgi:glycosyltransferase involved in cell wall biosynthesis
MSSITVIIPFFNNLENLKRAIASLSRQELLPSSIIVVDDCSPHYEKVERFAEEKHPFEIRVFQNIVNSGVSVARNLGLSMSTTKYVALLDEDDIWHPSKLRIQYALMEKYDLLITSTGFTFYNLKPETEILDDSKFKRLSFWSTVFRNQINTSSVMLRKDLYRLLQFNPNLRYAEDYDLWLRVLKIKSIYLISSPLTIRNEYSRHTGLSSNLDKMYQGEIKTIEFNLKSFIIKEIVKTFITLKYYKRKLKRFLYTTVNQK